MTRLLLTAFLLGAAALLPSRATGVSQTATRPLNFVVLVIDDTRWDSIGAAGNRIVQTPRIDALAAEGIRFAQARVVTSICMTSRASILTGQYMSRHGIDRFGKQLTPEAFARTYAGALRTSGYWTGHVGKYDVGTARESDYDFVRAYHGRHWITDGAGERVHVTEKNARDSLEFLRTRPKDKPFLLSVGYFAAHAEDSAQEQYLPQGWSAKLYEGITVPPSPLSAEKYLRALPPFLSKDSNEGRIRFKWRFDTQARYQEYMIRYYRLITEVDAAIGRLVDELKAQGVYENTLMVFIGDNGYFHGDRGLADKWYPYEQALRVPLVVRDPRLPARRRGATRDEVALNIDVAPTVLAAAGVAAPDVMQGRDLSPLYLGDAVPGWRDEFFYEHPTITSRDRIPSSQGVIRRDWKYVYYPEFEYEQLFNLKSDPEEIRNLVGDPPSASELSKMRQRLKEWRQRVR
ncbi:MAG: sulfatase [Vicinamibacterales bacterium]